MTESRNSLKNVNEEKEWRAMQMRKKKKIRQNRINWLQKQNDTKLKLSKTKRREARYSGAKIKIKGNNRSARKLSHVKQHIEDTYFVAMARSHKTAATDPTIDPNEDIYSGEVPITVQSSELDEQDNRTRNGTSRGHGSRVRAEANLVIMGSGDADGIPSLSCMMEGYSACTPCYRATRAFSYRGDTPDSAYRKAGSLLLRYSGYNRPRKSHVFTNVLINCGASFRESVIQMAPETRPRSIAAILTFSATDTLFARASFGRKRRSRSGSIAQGRAFLRKDDPCIHEFVGEDERDFDENGSIIFEDTSGALSSRRPADVSPGIRVRALGLPSCEDMYMMDEDDFECSQPSSAKLFRAFCVDVGEIEHDSVGRRKGGGRLVYLRPGPAFFDEDKLAEFCEIVQHNIRPRSDARTENGAGNDHLSSTATSIPEEVRVLMHNCGCGPEEATRLLGDVGGDVEAAENLYQLECAMEEDLLGPSSETSTPVTATTTPTSQGGRALRDLDFFDQSTLIVDISDAEYHYERPKEIVDALIAIVSAFGGAATLDGKGIRRWVVMCVTSCHTHRLVLIRSMLCCCRCIVVGISHHCNVSHCEKLLEVRCSVPLECASPLLNSSIFIEGRTKPNPIQSRRHGDSSHRVV